MKLPPGWVDWETFKNAMAASNAVQKANMIPNRKRLDMEALMEYYEKQAPFNQTRRRKKKWILYGCMSFDVYLYGLGVDWSDDTVAYKIWRTTIEIWESKQGNEY